MCFKFSLSKTARCGNMEEIKGNVIVVNYTQRIIMIALRFKILKLIPYECNKNSLKQLKALKINNLKDFNAIHSAFCLCLLLLLPLLEYQRKFVIKKGADRHGWWVQRRNISACVMIYLRLKFLHKDAHSDEEHHTILYWGQYYVT